MERKVFGGCANPSCSTSFLRRVTGWLILFATVVLLAGSVDPAYIDPEHKKFIFLIGTLGLWRYGNAINHYLRGLYFLYVRFPAMRRRVNSLGQSAMPSHLYMVVTSFRIPTQTTYNVYSSVFEEAVRVAVPTTVIVSIVERCDELFIRQIFDSVVSGHGKIKLIIVRARGTGKRDGLAHAFRALSRTMPEADAVVGVVDGDTMMMPGCIANAIGFFRYLPRVGGITTNEFCEVEGGTLIREWHTMRFVQRHINMCSMALSHRVLTMTGRLSFFRASILTEREFIEDVENDHLEHWRLGRFRFLTGDDKSSWFSLMRAGWDTFYVPDSITLTVEHPPDSNFFRATRQLMFRWYGNSLRQNFRAVRLLGRKRLGLFTLYVLYDQRISMWTCLLGLVTAVCAGMLFGIEYLMVYLFWISLSRTIATLLYGLSGHGIHPLYPLVLYYNQIVGSIMKVYALFHLDEQRWTRQKTKLANGTQHIDQWLNRVSSKVMLVCSASLFFGAVAFLLNLSQSVL